jgi:hypothetical protein
MIIPTRGAANQEESAFRSILLAAAREFKIVG